MGRDAFRHMGFCLGESDMPTYASGEETGLLAIMKGANMNTTSDQAIPINLHGTTKYFIERIMTTNASGAMTLVVGGIYTATNKGGTAVVSAVQAWSGLAGSTSLLGLTLASLTTVLTASTLYLSLSTPRGSAGTADIYIFGKVLP